MSQSTQPIQIKQVSEKPIVLNTTTLENSLSINPSFKVEANVVNSNGYDTVKFFILPGGELITNQSTMSYMDGGLETRATTGTSSSTWFSTITRGLTGQSILQNQIINPTSNKLKIVLSPLLQGSIAQINIQPGQTWKFREGSFMACTSNLAVGGDINFFGNLGMMIAGQSGMYVEIINKSNIVGTIWISSNGAIEKHEVEVGTGTTTPLYINAGCFLGMISNDSTKNINYWKDYITEGMVNDSIFSSMFTSVGVLLKVKDTIPPKRPGPIKIEVLTQSLNPANLDNKIRQIAQSVVEQATRFNNNNNTFTIKGGSDREKYLKYKSKYLALKNL